jgi:hypothetical protein
MFESSPQPTATRQSWPIRPLPEQHASLSLKLQFNQDEYEQISRGLIPEAMEDKWFIFLENDVLYVHRSWTGFCIYQVSLVKDGENYTVTEALVSRDPNQYSATDDAYDEKLLMFLINNLLLGKSSRFPVPAGVPVGIATGLYHHHVAGVGPKARQSTETMSLLGWLWAWLKWLIRG